jgi:hypothetical protein
VRLRHQVHRLETVGEVELLDAARVAHGQD